MIAWKLGGQTITARWLSSHLSICPAVVSLAKTRRFSSPLIEALLSFALFEAYHMLAFARLRTFAWLVLVAGAVAAMPAAQAQDIVVGQIGPFTVLPAPDAHEINKGAKAYFAQINERGGVN